MNHVYGGAFGDLDEDEILDLVPTASAGGYIVVGNTQASRVGQELAVWARQAEHLFGSRSNIYLLVDRLTEVSHTWVETTRMADIALQYVTTGMNDVESRFDPGYLGTFGHGRGHISTSTMLEIEPTTGSLFEELAEVWIDETQFESNLSATFTHEKYMQIIGLGPAAIPFLLQRLPDEPWRWDGALRFITRLNVGDSAKSSEETVAAWQDWARSQSFS